MEPGFRGGGPVLSAAARSPCAATIRSTENTVFLHKFDLILALPTASHEDNAHVCDKLIAI